MSFCLFCLKVCYFEDGYQTQEMMFSCSDFYCFYILNGLNRLALDGNTSKLYLVYNILCNLWLMAYTFTIRSEGIQKIENRN